MTDVVVGVDAGGTKSAIRVEALDGTRIADVVFHAEGWAAEPPEKATRWIAERVRTAAGDATVRAVGVGAQGCDRPEIATDLSAALSALVAPTRVVNDAELLLPAAGVDRGIAVIAGTGSIAVGASASGEPMFAGGWGWVIGDEGGGAAIVRDATIAALTARDRGADDDGLLTALLAAFEVSDAERLARAVNDDATIENWGPHAPAVFDAADAGSALAAAVIARAAVQLAELVSRLRSRGATGDVVVASGSVIARRARLFDAFRAAVRDAHPELDVRLLEDAPVAGAVAIARGLLS